METKLNYYSLVESDNNFICVVGAIDFYELIEKIKVALSSEFFGETTTDLNIDTIERVLDKNLSFSSVSIDEDGEKDFRDIYIYRTCVY